ncbi:MAG TPA: ABC transporter permease [Streptosporangiaceae bacterium]|nr:ABC transporter permease [Streptosporangiaceae bacterium]
MTTLAGAVRAPLAVNRRALSAAVFILLGLVDIFVFGLFSHHGDASFALSLPGAPVKVPTVHIPAAPVAYALGAVSIALGILRATTDLGVRAKRWSIAVVLIAFVLSLLLWADAGNVIPLNMVNLLQGTVVRSIPLILGALAGCMCERSGVININIEGQLLLGAFASAVVASVAGVLWFGLIAGSLAGGLMAALLAVFAIRYLVDQIILGVVLNVFATGLTGYLYDRALVPYENTLNSPATFSAIKIPLLGDIPIIGPIFFDSTIFLYITYLIIILVQVGLFHTKWGLHVRAVGEHPTAADTVGIRVLFNRYRNVILGGLIAGIGGAYLTIGSVGAFGKDISSGKGYIALAAMIFGRWTPLGAVGAALIFGFTDALQSILSTLNVPIPSNILLMAPYVATIVAVAGLVGRVRPPRADGKPYVKQ